jgi:hypothetical protein
MQKRQILRHWMIEQAPDLDDQYQNLFVAKCRGSHEHLLVQLASTVEPMSELLFDIQGTFSLA